MRRFDREVTDFNDKVKIMERCDVCRVVFNTGSIPYVLPQNFGIEVEGERVRMYFHGAMEGRKFELMAQNPNVGFEMDCEHHILVDEEKGMATMTFSSVIGSGILEVVEDEGERIKGLQLMMEHYGLGNFHYNPLSVPKTCILRLTVTSMSAKSNERKLQDPKYMEVIV